jgi:hypothetical protein
MPFDIPSEDVEELAPKGKKPKKKGKGGGFMNAFKNAKKKGKR